MGRAEEQPCPPPLLCKCCTHPPVAQIDAHPSYVDRSQTHACVTVGCTYVPVFIYPRRDRNPLKVDLRLHYIERRRSHTNPTSPLPFSHCQILASGWPISPRGPPKGAIEESEHGRPSDLDVRIFSPSPPLFLLTHDPLNLSTASTSIRLPRLRNLGCAAHQGA